jgi:transposase
LQGSNFYTVTLNSLFDRDEEKIVKIHEQGDTSIRKGAARFDVSKWFVQKSLKNKQTTVPVQP